MEMRLTLPPSRVDAITAYPVPAQLPMPGVRTRPGPPPNGLARPIRTCSQDCCSCLDFEGLLIVAAALADSTLPNPTGMKLGQLHACCRASQGDGPPAQVVGSPCSAGNNALARRQRHIHLHIRSAHLTVSLHSTPKQHDADTSHCTSQLGLRNMSGLHTASAAAAQAECKGQLCGQKRLTLA